MSPLVNGMMPISVLPCYIGGGEDIIAVLGKLLRGETLTNVADSTLERLVGLQIIKQTDQLQASNYYFNFLQDKCV